MHRPTTGPTSATARDKMYGHRARIGYISPPRLAEVFPLEFYRIAPEGVTLAISTLAVSELSKAEIEQSQVASLQAARAMVEAGVDVVVFGGAPINMASGGDDPQAMIAALEAELKARVTTSAWCQEKAVRALGCRKVVIAHGYDASQHARQASYAEKFGCEVLGVAGWGRPLRQFGAIPRDAALELGRTLLREHREADAILLPSPHWPTIEAIEPLEREFGVSVVSAAQAAIWDGLRLAGVKDRIAGYGRLLREF
jgi:maleate isomerase